MGMCTYVCIFAHTYAFACLTHIHTQTYTQYCVCVCMYVWHFVCLGLPGLFEVFDWIWSSGKPSELNVKLLLNTDVSIAYHF